MNRHEGRKRRFALITLVYWFLLAYLVAALAWWYIELRQQNQEMYAFKKDLLRKDMPEYDLIMDRISNERDRNDAQYAGEGLMFLILTLLGAVFVYRAARRQIRFDMMQENFLMAVTHELKTPISILRLNLETMLKFPLEEPDRRRMMQQGVVETERLNELCENILISSRLESAKQVIEHQSLDLNAMIHEAAETYHQRMPSRRIIISDNEIEKISGDPLLLRLCLHNLIDNAIKYSPADKPVILKTEPTLSGIRITVADEGPGIPDTEKEKIFGRFYRAGSEHIRKTKGTGLGLYLSKKIAQAHGGSLKVKDNRPQGSIFVMEIPNIKA
jgi:two-component system, OmpR family, sensor histidine kinase CiaH